MKSAERWTALVPFKPPGERKTRLSPHLSVLERDRLAEKLFAHVTAVLQATDEIYETILLSTGRFGWPGPWIDDGGGGLNRELQAAQKNLFRPRLLVIHADLPLLRVQDVQVLLSAATGSGAIAVDHHNSGTNALALYEPSEFSFAFGPRSFEKHVQGFDGRACIVERNGLALDIDTATDLEQATRYGFSF